MTVLAKIRWSKLLAAFAVCFALISASNVFAQSKGKTVFIAHGVDLESINPYWHNTTANYAVWRHFLEPLAEYDFAKKRYVGVLAESGPATKKVGRSSCRET